MFFKNSFFCLIILILSYQACFAQDSPTSITPVAATVLQGSVQDKAYEDQLSKQKIIVLDLDTALALAADQNLNLEIQEYNVKTARDRLVGRTSEFLPSVSVINTMLQRDGHIQIFGNQAVRIRQKSVQPRIVNSFNFFQGGRVLFGWIAQNNVLKAEKQRLTDTEQAVLTNTANAFFAVQRFQAELESELVRSQQAEQNLKERETALRLGDDIKLSVLLAEQEAQESKARIANLRGQFYTQSSQLNTFLNLPIETLILPAGRVDEADIVGWQGQPSLQRLIGTAIQNRPDVLAQQFEVKAQRARQTQTISAFLPTVGLSNTLGLIGPNYANLYGDEQLALTIQYDALRNLGGVATADYLLAKHTKQQLQTQLGQITKQIESDIAGLYLAVSTGRDALIANKAAYVAAEESFRQARVRLREGVGTPFEITVAQSGLERARANYFDALINYKVSQVNLLRGLGIINRQNLVSGIKL
jgi:outer membrane protein TolC